MRGAPGFTLYETLIALAVLGIAATASTAAMQSSFIQSAKARAKVEAVQHAESVLSAIGSSLPFKQGQYDVAIDTGTSAHVAITSRPDLPQSPWAGSPTAPSGPRPAVYDIRVEIRDSKNDVLVRLVTFRLGER